MADLKNSRGLQARGMVFGCLVPGLGMIQGWENIGKLRYRSSSCGSVVNESDQEP